MDRSTNDQNNNAVQVESQNSSAKEITPETAAAKDVNFTRRRALIAGLAAVPVLLTLKSQSAFAQTAETPCSIILSLHMEGGYSQHPNVTYTQDELTQCKEN